ncbi:MAG: aminotransferase class I/II-fold pyridoxal phosphate-dependent enzyme [Isosphaeraceae bacterium]
MRLAPASTIEPSRIRSIAVLADEHPGTLRLFYGEDTLPTPDFIKAAAHRAIDANLTYYTPNAGYPALREAIAQTLSRLHGLERDPAGEIVVTASGMVALHLACLATLGHGTSALVVTPAWPNIPAAVRLAGAEAIEVPLRESGERFCLDLDHLEASVRPDTRALIVTSPSNPTGWTATPDDWTRILGFCEKHDLWLIADGVYERLVAPGEVAPCPIPCERGSERTILANSFSKTYRMTGWRVGYLVAPREVARLMTHLQEFVVSHASGIAQEAARVALLEGEEFVLEQQARYARHRSIAVERLRTIDGVDVPGAGQGVLGSPA